MRWSKRGNDLWSTYGTIIGACLSVTGILLLTQVLPNWVGTLLLGVTLLTAGIFILKRTK